MCFYRFVVYSFPPNSLLISLHKMSTWCSFPIGRRINQLLDNIVILLRIPHF